MTVKTNSTELTLSGMKAQMAKKKPLKVAKKKAPVKVSTDVKAKKVSKPKTEKKIIDKAANLTNLKKSVSKAFGKGFTITESPRVSKYGGMLQILVNSTGTVFEVWDEVEVNNRICIFTNETAYEKYKANLSKSQRDACVSHPKWKMNKQFYIAKEDITTTLNKIATGLNTATA